MYSGGLFHSAWGERTEHAEINIYSGSTFHSLLSPSDFSRSHFGDKLIVERTDLIEIKRLDEVLEYCRRGIHSPRLYLKMDTQGHDLAVVAGAGAALDRILALLTEVTLRPICEDMRATLWNVIPPSTPL